MRTVKATMAERIKSCATERSHKEYNLVNKNEAEPARLNKLVYLVPWVALWAGKIRRPWKRG